MPIFDQGYQHWSGKLSGHAWRWLAIARHGVRGGLKNRGVRLFLMISWLPALLLATLLCLWGMVERKSDLIVPVVESLQILDKEVLADPHHYRVEIWTLCFNYFLQSEVYLSMFLILLVGPNLISQDLRFNALPLYFSRPLRRIDYFFGKLAVIGAFIGMVVVVPSLVAYLLGLLFSLDFSILRDTLPLLLYSLAYGVLIALSAGSLILAFSSLSRNSRYVALFWLAFFMGSGSVATVLEGVDREQRHHAAFRRSREFQQLSIPPTDRPLTPEEHMQWQQSVQDAHQEMFRSLESRELEAAKTSWRPLVSYTANLTRLGQQLLGTEAAWEKLAKLQPANLRQRFLLAVGGYRYPWCWSAAVLAGLLGFSACILHRSIKSLDRLK